MIVQRRPGGGWETATGRQVWHNRNGRRTLTPYGEVALRDFQDLTIHVPVIESAIPTPGHPPTATRQTWYPISANSLPQMMEVLLDLVPLAYADSLQNLPSLPPEFKTWVLEQLDPELSGVLDESSDRRWHSDDTRPWYMSVQHVEVGADGRARLVTDLDRPMLATQLLYHDIPCHWLLAPVASTPHDCVPLSLVAALGTELEATKRRLGELAQERGTDPAQGYFREVVLQFLEEHAAKSGRDCGWKVLGPNGSVLAERRPERGGPFLMFVQRANHLFLYSMSSALNGVRGVEKKPRFVGLRQHTRPLTDIPQELRTKCLEEPGPSLSLWQLRAEKKQTYAEETELTRFTDVRPGVFFQMI